MTSRIEDYALIGNLRTAALVHRNGDIQWLCLPRFDSDACFASLVGECENGHWQIQPAEGIKTVKRRYRDETLVLETTFETDSGVVLLIDFMPLPREGEQTIEVMRIVVGKEGRVPMRMEAVLRFDYGRVAPWVRSRDYGIHAIVGPDAVRLTTPIKLRGENMTTVADFTVSADERVPFTLTWHRSYKDGSSAESVGDLRFG